VVSRLTSQKGMDLLLATLPRLLADVGSSLCSALAIPVCRMSSRRRPRAIGDGSAPCSAITRACRTCCKAAPDVILVPSRFEPCGLTQLIGLRYGAVPVVARVGGLADTVIDANDAALAAGARHRLPVHTPSPRKRSGDTGAHARLHRDPAAWRSLQARGMATDVSWRRPARQYADLYQAVAERL